MHVLVTSFSYVPNASFNEKLLLLTLIMHVFVRSFSYTPNAVLVRSFSY